MHIDWDNTMVTGISGIKIYMPSDAKVSIFTDNDLTHINDDHFKINLVSLRHSVNGDFCGHSRFVLWHENLTTFVS